MLFSVSAVCCVQKYSHDEASQESGEIQFLKPHLQEKVNICKI